MRRRSVVKKIAWTVILLALIVGGYFIYPSLSKDKKKQTEFQKLVVERGDIYITVLSTGVVTPKNRLDIKPPIAGRVDKLLVDEGDLVREGQILAYMSSTERAGLMDSASAKGSAEVKAWKSLFKPTPILAPISGTIIKRNVVAGQTFNTGEAVYTMSDRLIVNAQVDETDIGMIRLKQKVLLTLDAYPKVKVFGQVSKIAYDATTVSNVTTYVVELLPDEIPEIMRSGMTANVTFDIDTKSNILLVPQGAIKVKSGRSYVQLDTKEKDKEPVETQIEVGLTDGKRIEVLSGLKEGDTILAPVFKLDDAASGGSPFSPFGRSRAPKKPKS